MQEYLKTLPQFILSVKDEEEDETNVYITSIVDEPAMMRDFAKFSEGKQKLYFKEQKDKRILSGVWVLADTPIYRKYNDFEFTVVFESERLKEMLFKHIKSGYSDIHDFNHDEKVIKDAFQNVEYWIYDGNPSQKSPILGLTLSDLGYNPEDIKEGSILKSVYVKDEVVWEYIKDGDFNGFSIDGLFDIQSVENQFRNNKYIKKTEEMFRKLSINQFSGEIILNDESMLKVTPSEISMNGEKVMDGTFSTKNDFKIIVKEGEVVDFGFDDESKIEEPILEVVEEVVETKEVVDTVEETKEEVVNKEEVVEKTDNSVQTVVEETTPVQPKEEEPKFDMSIINDLKKEIQDLKSSLEKEKQEKENVLKKNTIPTKKTVKQNPDNYKVRKVGKETIYIPK